MGRETEKMHKELEAFLKENGGEDLSEEQLNGLIQAFMKRYNSKTRKRVTPENAKTSDDYLELAENAASKAAALRHASKSLQLDPDNLDAARLVAEISSTDPLDMLNRLDQAVGHGNRVLESKGLMDEESAGRFWLIVETRPYMRLRHSLMQSLKDAGMMRKAAAECEEMLRLCSSDNLGIRFSLMHLYAFLEKEEAALKLCEKFDGYHETQMLLPLSVLYYKLYRLDKAKEYLDRLAKVNRDAKKFFRAIRQQKLDPYMEQMDPDSYRPFSIEELLIELMENRFLFLSVPGYFWWADRQLAAKRK